MLYGLGASRYTTIIRAYVHICHLAGEPFKNAGHTFLGVTSKLLHLCI